LDSGQAHAPVPEIKEKKRIAHHHVTMICFNHQMSFSITKK